ncbi:uncharacterized protein LOC126708314 [Quercus robur]|uniref:uncharacterized protein LOC126708314 n=1 Tax=Quercus robur TaxID=38942 RepID=UPI0021628179|nr:uncharacterized protein LOC126708314 [Quercus robur]
MAETDSATKVMEKDPARADPLDDYKGERKFEDQDQDFLSNQSPQHSMKVGLSIQVVRPRIQHPRPGRWLLQIQVPLILTQLGLIDSQPS